LEANCIVTSHILEYASITFGYRLTRYIACYAY